MGWWELDAVTDRRTLGLCRYKLFMFFYLRRAPQQKLRTHRNTCDEEKEKDDQFF
jgi:hypothetical protein